MRQEASSIKDVLSAVIQNLAGEKKTKIEIVKEAFGAALGETAKAHAAPVAFKAKRLVVNVDSSSWMYELNLKKPQILAGLNQKLKKENIQINDIMFRIGEIQ